MVGWGQWKILGRKFHIKARAPMPDSAVQTCYLILRKFSAQRILKQIFSLYSVIPFFYESIFQNTHLQLPSNVKS